ncbi:Na(+)/H(+) antiporter subunit C [Patulibacter sp. SYSU D01012]|uniref:Na(+)/H(+) antiporter subunit C n=1 Tax=Patulibacter sp. SYSU D01012 TaxID=2817381 RepID=UPI001B312F86
MSVSLVLAVVVGVLVAGGVVLLLERSLTRVLLGAVLLGNGLNVMILAMGGVGGEAPILGEAKPADMSDPLPQVMILTSIVITFAMTAFLLALAYRSWQLQGNDEVQDDVEDRVIAARRGAAEDSGADAEADAEADARAAVAETATTRDDDAIERDA